MTALPEMDSVLAALSVFRLRQAIAVNVPTAKSVKEVRAAITGFEINSSKFAT